MKKKPWEMTLHQYAKDRGGTKKTVGWAHCQEIKEALAEGKFIPGVVLKEYPWLVNN